MQTELERLREENAQLTASNYIRGQNLEWMIETVVEKLSDLFTSVFALDEEFYKAHDGELD